LRRSEPHRVEHGWQNVDVPHGIVDDTRREEPRLIHDQRHTQRRVVRKQSVSLFAVVAQRFAMVAGDDDERAAVAALLQNRLKERRQRRVGR